MDIFGFISFTLHFLEFFLGNGILAPKQRKGAVG
jgi:hypothetical protein